MDDNNIDKIDVEKCHHTSPVNCCNTSKLEQLSSSTTTPPMRQDRMAKDKKHYFEPRIIKWMILCSNNNFDDITQFLDKNKDLLDRKDPLWGTCLHWSIKNNNFPLFEYLLNKGANVNSRNMDGNTPLHLIEKYNRLRMFNVIINNTNLNSNIPNFYNHIPYKHQVPPKTISTLKKKTTIQKPLRKFLTVLGNGARPKIYPSSKNKQRPTFKISNINTDGGNSLTSYDDNNLYTTPIIIKKFAIHPNKSIYRDRWRSQTTLNDIDNNTKNISGYLDLYTKGVSMILRPTYNTSTSSLRTDLKQNITSRNTLDPEQAICETFRNQNL